MSPRAFAQLEIGDRVRFTQTAAARYSGYGGRPVRVIQVGEVLTLRDVRCIPVRGKAQYFHIANAPDWGEGVAVWADYVEKAP